MNNVANLDLMLLPRPTVYVPRNNKPWPTTITLILVLKQFESRLACIIGPIFKLLEKSI